MKIYSFSAIDAVEMVVADTKNGRTVLSRQMDGTRYGDSWVPLDMSLLRTDERGRPLEQSDAPTTANATPVFRASALDVVGALPGDYEILPLRCPQADLVLVNPTAVLGDALDEERTEYDRLSSGKVVSIWRPVFNEHVVANVPIFRAVQQPRGFIYFCEFWADALRRLNNVGMKVVWDSELSTTAEASRPG